MPLNPNIGTFTFELLTYENNAIINKEVIESSICEATHEAVPLIELEVSGENVDIEETLIMPDDFHMFCAPGLQSI